MNKALVSSIFLIPISVFAASTTTVRQGDVAFIEMQNDCYKSSLVIPKLGTYPILTFQNKKLVTVPIDLYQATGTYSIPKCVKKEATSTLTIISREKEVEEFIIPKEQGGNSSDNASKVKKEIQNDSRVLNVFSNKKQLWSKPFAYPVKEVTVTDTYGYSRDSSGVNIVHKGLDFKADIGTPVYAMNRGVVRYVGILPTYGRTVIIDHGRGIQTVYLHLSKVLVKEGSLIQRSQMLGRAGNTGFVTGPHLHLSIRVLGISVDPENFMKSLGGK